MVSKELPVTNPEMTSDSSASNQEKYASCAVCRECDLLVDVGHLPPGHKACCPRCGFVLSRARANAVDRMLVFSITAVICLMFSGLFDFVQMSVQGQEREITLLETVRELFALDQLALAAFMLVVIIGLPAVFIGLVSWLVLSVKLKMATRQTIILLRIIGYLRFWNMAEIFFLGILISMVKVASLADVAVGLSFWMYALFNVFLIAAMMHLDKFQLGQVIKQIVRERQATANEC